MARRKSSKRVNRKRDNYGRFMEAAENKAKRKANKRKATKQAAKKARKAAKRVAKTVKASAKAQRKAQRKAAKSTARSKPRKSKKTTSRKQSRREDTTMAKKKSGKKKNKSGRKAQRSATPQSKKSSKKKTAARKAAATKAAKAEARRKAGKKAAATRRRNAAKASSGGSKKKRKKSKAKRPAAKAATKRKARRTTTATIAGTRRVRSGGHTRSAPTSIRITVGAPQKVTRKKASTKRKKGKSRKGAHEGFMLNPVATEYSMENPMTGGEMVLAAVAGGFGYVFASMADRYIATRDHELKPGEPALSPAEAAVAPPGIMRVLAQGGIAAAAMVGAYFVPQPMGRAALQGLGLGALVHLSGQVITTYVVARFLNKNDTVRKMYAAEIAVSERLHPPKATGQQGLPYGVAGFLRPGVAAYDPTLSMYVANGSMIAPPLSRATTPVAPPPGTAAGDCGPCGGGCNNPEQGTLNAIEAIANVAPKPGPAQTLTNVMSAVRDEVCRPGVGATPFHNAMHLGRDD